MGPDGFWSLVGDVDILLPNRHEARILSGHADPGSGATITVRARHLVVIKLDRDGCIAGDGRHIIHAPAPAITVVNATGAGDAFNAAFLSSHSAGFGLCSGLSQRRRPRLLRHHPPNHPLMSF